MARTLQRPVILSPANEQRSRFVLTFNDIETAHGMLAAHVRRTPVMDLEAGALGLDHPLNLKLELFQHAGSFKPRGAFYNLLSQPVPAAGVTAASGGNHGIAVAHAARKLGHRAKIFVPVISSPVKVAAIEARGAEVVVGGAHYDEARKASDAYAQESGALSVQAFDSWETITGQGTVALEWLGQVEALDTVLIAVGGGGLISGMACAFNGRVKVVGVEPEGACCLHTALAAGHPVTVTSKSIAADSLGALNCGDRVFSVAHKHVDHVALVGDEAIRSAQTGLWNTLRIAAEPGGAAALAAVLSGAYRPERGERVGILVCGGNVALDTLG